MNRVRVKICGVRSLSDARSAIEAGADAIGFNFWPESPRYIEPALARTVIASLPPFVSRVGVFVNDDADHIAGIATSVGLDAVQLHGDETPDFCQRLRLTDHFKAIALIKAVRVETEADLGGIRTYRAGAILLDSKKRGAYGGTGEHFDWRLAVRAAEVAPIILAGGLRVENVREAIA